MCSPFWGYWEGSSYIKGGLYIQFWYTSQHHVASMHGGDYHARIWSENRRSILERLDYFLFYHRIVNFYHHVLSRRKTSDSFREHNHRLCKQWPWQEGPVFSIEGIITITHLLVFWKALEEAFFCKGATPIAWQHHTTGIFFGIL